MSYHEMTDEELYEELKKADLAEKFLESPQGKLIQEAALRIVDRAVTEFALAPSDILKDPEKLAELRVIIRKYRFGLFEEIKQISREGFLIYEEFKTRRSHQSENGESLNTAEKGDE